MLEVIEVIYWEINKTIRLIINKETPIISKKDIKIIY